ncbi:YebC/PmpR family DNA-binding transcriptional regulator [Sodaliphilus sp.]|uniref:YebC/PmpR family DNA-binding transcriptional regulator n=1 Tax=Sodaliphilus sp. TaxID=2815818 RepID=UPI0038911158
MGRAFEYRKARIMARNSKNSKAFSKFSKEITMCVKASGPDPDTNSRLRTLMASAKSAGMPKDTIERAIKKASDKDAKDYKTVIYEGYAPNGIAILVETATDNTTRTVANLRSYFNKKGGSLGNSGSVAFMFTHKCYFHVTPKDGIELDELELELIDCGAEEVDMDEEEIMISGAFESNGEIQKYLEENGFEIISSEFVYEANDYKELTAEQAAQVEALIEVVEEDEDVQSVFTTMQTADVEE